MNYFQVQRCVDDMSVLTTTYEGTHNHPLPISATAMASTTAAAASMLQSRSTTSSSNNNLHSAGGLNNNFITGPSTTSTSLFQSSNIRQPLPQQFYLIPNCTSISNSTTHPTVTLDLTVPNPSSSSSHMGPRYSSTCLSFSSSSSSSVLPWNFSNVYNNNGYLSKYGIMSPHGKTNPIIGSHGLVINSDGNYNKQPFQEASNNNLYQTYVNNIVKQSISSTIASTHNHQQSLTESIAAATKAITSNPNFQSALAAALTSIVGKGESGV